MKRAARTAPVILLVLGAACGDDPTAPQDPEDVTFHPSLEIDLAQMTRLPSGVYIQTVAEGQGAEAAATDSVTLAYETWLPDGTQTAFGDILDQPLDGYVAGFVEGVTGMKPGGARKIVVPSELGFGSQARDRVPPNSVLIFFVSLISFH